MKVIACIVAVVAMAWIRKYSKLNDSFDLMIILHEEN
jgi:hypothetical protein